MEAKRFGAEVDILRLTEFRIEPCKGCMACIFKQEDCRISDDWSRFRDTLLESDAAILGAPTYLLGPAGIIKMITDRNIALMFRKNRSEVKPGAIIGVSGVKGWETFALPMLNVFMLSCGLKVIDQVMFYAQGPSEILLDDLAVERVRKLGSNIYEAASKQPEEMKYYGEQGACPICHQNLFSIKDGKLECTLCQAKAEVKTIKDKIELSFYPETLKENRWSEKALREHFSSAILPSGPRFLKKRDEIRKRTQKYLSFK